MSVSTEKRLVNEFLAAGRELGFPIKDVNGNQEACKFACPCFCITLFLWFIVTNFLNL